ncbi:NPR3 [Candida oxycetoniae]|uniref:Nitrogen permease regulator 3 n=1 Tax=Candida oxycetoniae TaxID=497107 RepID=A0AAI9WVT4_9ASCO|nr:NPR3 [Candida oxycetoniae]KAI3402316.2 NPR3 [Candida oxycetoniae]
MSFNLPNPCLIGILLIISTHSGPQLVYKYPTDLSSGLSSDIDQDGRITHNSSATTDEQTNNAEKDEEEEEDEDELYEYRNDEDLVDDQNSQHLINETGTDRNLYGINRSWDFRHLQYYLGTKLDLKTFLDEQDGRRKQLRQRKEEKNQSRSVQVPHAASEHKDLSRANSENKSFARTVISDKGQAHPTKAGSINDKIFGMDPAYLCEMLAPPRPMCNTRFEVTIEDKVFLGLPTHRHDNGAWKTKFASNNGSYSNTKHNNGGVAENDSSATTSGSTSNLNMFHLVFVMNPPAIENNYRVDEMFQHVISKLSLVLRHAQQKHNYVGQQVKTIFKLRDEMADERSLAQYSSLCKLICDCYHAISSSKIANLLIDGKMKSFQIPVKSEFHSLPEASVPFIPGSYLCSASNILNNNGFVNVGESSRYDHTHHSQIQTEESTEEIIVYFALLLLDEPENIIKDIKTSKDSVLSEFIRTIQPTESLLKFSIRVPKFDILQVKSFAFHLIYWRRARIIQPLSSRSVYVVSPMSSLTIKLYEDISAFKDRFPTLPSLPHFLKLLSPQSRKPQQYASIIPSRDHRGSYLEALSWLTRFGYVTQQLTFIWLKISKKIKIKIEEDIENETLAKRGVKTKTPNIKTKSTDNTSKQTGDIIASQGNNNILKGHEERDTFFNTEEAIMSSLNEHFKKSSLVSIVEDDDTIILDPGRASTLERRWINELIFEECKLSSELTAIFYKLLKYMNGESPLELLLLKENVSRAELKKLLYAIEDHIISVRHW